MKYRSRSDVVASILEASRDGALKTHIMYNAALSFSQMQEYMDLLIENGLLDVDGNTYRTTKKGAHSLEVFRELEQMLISREKAAGKTTHALA